MYGRIYSVNCNFQVARYMVYSYHVQLADLTSQYKIRNYYALKSDALKIHQHACASVMASDIELSVRFMAECCISFA